MSYCREGREGGNKQQARERNSKKVTVTVTATGAVAVIATGATRSTIATPAAAAAVAVVAEVAAAVVAAGAGAVADSSSTRGPHLPAAYIVHRECIQGQVRPGGEAAHRVQHPCAGGQQVPVVVAGPQAVRVGQPRGGWGQGVSQRAGHRDRGAGSSSWGSVPRKQNYSLMNKMKPW